MKNWTLILLALSVWSCAERTPRDEHILVEIDDRVVTVGEFDRFVASSVQKDQPFLADDVMQALLEQFIEEQLLLLAADEAGVRADPDQVSSQLAVLRSDDIEASTPERDERMAGIVDRQLRIQALVEAELFSGLSVSEEEVESHFEDNRAFFRRPETVSVSQILVETASDAASLRDELVADPTRFEELAELHSVGPEAERSGFLGRFGRGELPPSIENTVFSLDANRVSDVVETDFGFHIFRVDEKTAASSLEIDAVRDKIRVDLLRDKSEQELARYVDELKQKYPVTVYREHLSFAFLGWEDQTTANANTEASP